MTTTKYLSDLSDDYEYALVCFGQSNGRPLGAESEMESVASEMVSQNVGAAFTLSTVPGTGPDSKGRYDLSISIGSLTTNEWAGEYIRLGTATTAVAGYGKVISNTSSSLVVQWIITPTPASSVAAYVVREIDWRFANYPQVRVLTPYMPVLPAADSKLRDLDYPTPNGATLADNAAKLVIPGYSLPAGVTSFKDMAVFLPYCNHEGQAGYGESDVYPTSNAGITATASTFQVTSMVAPTDYFAGGYIVVEWEEGGAVKRAWAKLDGNTNSGTKTYDLDADGWQGDDPTAGAPANWRWTAWVPHYDDSPYAYLPGFQFSYPNNDFEAPSLAASVDGPVFRCRARGVDVGCYTTKRVGAWLLYAMRLSATLGKRINVILLAVSGTSLYPSRLTQPGGFQGQWGWWDFRNAHDWDPTRSDGNFARLKSLISPMAGYALQAEGNTKPLRVLALAGIQGEGDAGKVSGRETYDETVRRFFTYLRDYIEEAGLSPYQNGARIPIVLPTIAVDPNELDDKDPEGFVNDGIRRFVISDQFAVTFKPDEAERAAATPPNNIHYNGAGYARIGAWMHEAVVPAIEYALSFGSPVLNAQPAGSIDICNRALGLLGESSRITSLDDGSFEADLCRDYYPDARDALLQMRRWTFAERRDALEATHRPVPDNYPHYPYVYLIPEEALCGFALLPESPDSDYTRGAVELEYGTELVYGSNEAPQPFIIEEHNGVRYLFTALDKAVLRYTKRIVNPDQFSPMFRNALSYLLASYLAGPIIKGQQGESTSERLLRKALAHAAAAQNSDTEQRSMKPIPAPNWLVDR